MDYAAGERRGLPGADGRTGQAVTRSNYIKVCVANPSNAVKYLFKIKFSACD